MDKISVSPGVPLELQLAYGEGRPVRGNKMMFSTVDRRVLFVPMYAGAVIDGRLRDLGVCRGDRVIFLQERTFEKGKPVKTWRVYRSPAMPVGQQRNGTFCVPTQPGATRRVAL